MDNRCVSSLRCRITFSFCLCSMLLLSALAVIQPAYASHVLQLTNGQGKTTQLSMTQLNAMPQFSISTCTPWTEQRHTFSGPKLSQVLAQAGIYNQRIEIQAINGYQITLSPADLSPYAPILATEIDGKPMRIRDKGPLWLILPLDQYPVLHKSLFYAQMAWQIKSIRAVKD